MLNIIKLFVILFSGFLGINSFAQETDVFKGNDKKPVEITSDQLEVYRKEDKAIFSGNVLAKQGNVNLRSEEMTIYYKANKAKGKKADDGSKPTNSISKVETKGKIFLSTPKETAQGDKGVYDVDKKVVTILGNVTLTSGKSIVRGEEMVYNLATGQSKMISSGQGETVPGQAGKKQRVRGVFVPE